MNDATSSTDLLGTRRHRQSRKSLSGARFRLICSLKRDYSISTVSISFGYRKAIQGGAFPECSRRHTRARSQNTPPCRTRTFDQDVPLFCHALMSATDR
jgi:hypothetical protein